MKRFYYRIIMLFLIIPASLFAQGKTKKSDPKIKVQIEKKNSNSEDEYTKLVAEFSRSSDEEKELFVYECKYTRAENLSKFIENFLTPRGTTAASKESDMLAIEDVKSNIKKLKALAEKIDRYIPKVVVEARIVEFTLDTDFEKEVEIAYKSLPAGSAGFIQEISSVLNTPGANPNPTQGNRVTLTPYQNNKGALTMFLRYMQTKGKATILNATNLTVMRGEDASIITGEEVPILSQTITGGSVSTSTEFKSVGTKLRVKPIMIVGDKIRLEINPEVSSVTSFSSAGDGISNPVIAVRNAKTIFDINNQQMLSIGGLLSKEKREVDKRVPYLSSIPLLGWFFRSKRLETVHTQVVIFLTVNILKGNEDFVNQPSHIPQNIIDEIDKIKDSLPKQENTLDKDKKLILDQK